MGDDHSDDQSEGCEKSKDGALQGIVHSGSGEREERENTFKELFTVAVVRGKRGKTRSRNCSQWQW